MNNNFVFKKKYGQNFLNDHTILNRIMDQTLLDENTLVIEIGPGGGALTSLLAVKSGKVVCYEIDVTLKPHLDQLCQKHPNIEVIYQDFLEADVFEHINHYQYSRVCIVANIPYYITGPIINKIIELRSIIKEVVLMVQDEVADRICALPGGREYGFFSVLVNYYFNTIKAFKVDHKYFTPVPNVDSAVVLLKTKIHNECYAISEANMFQLVKDAFRHKRKNLRNNLNNYDLDLIERLLMPLNYDLTVRAEQLPVDFFIKLSNEIELANKK